MPLVRVTKDGLEFNVGASLAKAKRLDVLDESPFDKGGAIKPVTRKGGRKRKPNKSIDVLAAEKAEKSVSLNQSDTTPSDKE